MRKQLFILFAFLGVLVSCSKNEPESSPETPDPSAVTDLSTSGTANCYIVPAAGNYKFKATVKGSSTESVGTPVSAEVLWESFGTSVKPNVGDIVGSVSLENGYVNFSTPSTLADGNAAIAVKDASGNILWSWHIWVCKDFYPSVPKQIYYKDAGTMMDRNLGATSTKPGNVQALGLLYQWGRKDPFLGSSSISSSVVAESTLVWPSFVVSDENIGTIAYAVAHPTTFISNEDCDWLYSASSDEVENTRWQTTDKIKGLYDPCPPGWRVPNGGSNGVWSKAFGTYDIDGAAWNSKNKGMDFGYGNGLDSSHQLGRAPTIWYPAAGCRAGWEDDTLCHVGSIGNYWSCTPGWWMDGYACCFELIETYSADPYGCSNRVDAFSVRCIKG